MERKAQAVSGTGPGPRTIQPTVCRFCYFFDSAPSADKGPKAAMIVKTWNDRLVNLVVWDENGNSSPRTSVVFVQPGDTRPEGGSFAEWMPYTVAAEKERAGTDETRKPE